MLPNCADDADLRFGQFVQAMERIYAHFGKRKAHSELDDSALSILVNPIPGEEFSCRAGRFYCPMSSGVADSVFKYPLTTENGPQDPNEGFARVAFGHGYAVVRDAFQVIPIATVKKPLRPALMGNQRFFFALKLSRDLALSDDELSTMAQLNMKLADPRLRQVFTDDKARVNFDRLVMDDLYGYRSGLDAIIEQLHKMGGHFQIEFTWNLVNGRGVFHIVQYKRLRAADSRPVEVPPRDDRALIATDQFQGHGVHDALEHAVVINPFAYSEDQHDQVLDQLDRFNKELGAQHKRYILVCPGRLGSKNRSWGFNVEFPSICHAAVVVEYGYDTKGSASIEVTRDELTGGIYGSHFLYQVLGGAHQAEKARRARMFGSQGTHFLTNLYTKGVHYLFVNPAEHHLSPWFFSPPEGQKQEPVYVKTFDEPVAAYADIFGHRCLVTPARPVAREEPHETVPDRAMRVINPHKVTRAFVFAMDR